MGQSGLEHSFSGQLAYSERQSDELFWEQVYRHFFPNLLCHMPANGNTESQRRGIDRILLLNNGRLLNIQEKKRRETRLDILLEYLSNDKTDALGWIEKDLDCDYLAYAFMNTGRVILLPWDLLRLAWLTYGDEWKSTYFNAPAKNVGYITWSVAVPIHKLTIAIMRVSQVRGVKIKCEEMV